MLDENEDMEKGHKIEKIEDIKDDEIMTVGEVAAYFKVSEADGLKLVEEGDIPAFKIAGHWRISKSDLAKCMDKMKRGSTE